MSRIRILPEILSNKIAAGEVVERPASVVKELVENALDAGSSRITVDVEKGGRSLIQVADNGAGMRHDDALLSVERYATSKLRDEADLFSIRTLGFRGEALPSIAAVSRFTLETRETDTDAGTRIEVDGGRIRNVSDVGAPPGTLVTVRKLFYNTPARRKFLKTVNTEMGHIGDTLASIALGWPHVQFRLRHNGRAVKSWPGVTESLDRAVDVLGTDLRGALHAVSCETEEMTLSGWVADPAVSRTTSRGIYVYVNGRCVRDRMVQHALNAGYAGRLMKGQFPVAVLFITVPPDQVDVNVHPAKSEVRFVRSRQVHDAISDAVLAALKPPRRERRPDHRHDRDTAAPFLMPDPEPEIQPDVFPAPGLAEPAAGYVQEEKFPAASPPPEPARPPDTSPRTGPGSVPVSNDPAPERNQTSLWPPSETGFADLKIIGQFQNTYILCEAENGLVVIDQHAAHERVLFEQLRDGAGERQAQAQSLLVPETLEVSFQEADLLERVRSAFGEIGLTVEPFGGRTYAVKSVPALLADRPVTPLIAALLEKMAEVDLDTGTETAMDACYSVMACHGAIRAGQSLDIRQMQALLAQLDRCQIPSHCPHGRPTWIRWGSRFLEKSFRRIV